MNQLSLPTCSLALFVLMACGCGPSRNIPSELAKAAVDGTPVQRFTLGDSVARVAFSPDSQTLLASTFGDNMSAWDVSTGKNIWTEYEEGGTAYSFAFTSDGKSVVAGLADGYLGDNQQVKLYDLADRKEVKTIGKHSGFVKLVALLPSGELLSGGEDGVVRIWNLDSGTEIRQMRVDNDDSLLTFALSPDFKAIAVMPPTETVSVWDVASGRKKFELPSGPAGDWADGIGFRTTSGNLLVITPLDNMESDETTYRFDEYTSTDGRHISSWTAGGALYHWSEFVVSPDGRLLACGSGNHLHAEVVIWELDSRRIVVRLQGHQHIINGMAFSADGTMLATASEDGTACVWKLPAVP